MCIRVATYVYRLSILGCVLSGVSLFAQSSSLPGGVGARSAASQSPESLPPTDPFVSLRLKQMYEKERMRSLRKDSLRLREMCAMLQMRLQEHSDFNDEDRKLLQEIEKTARALRGRMRD